MTAVILIQHSRLYGRAPRQEMSVCVGAQTSLPLAGQMRNLRCESLRMKEMNTHTVPPSRMLNLPVRVPAGSIHDSSAGTRLLLVSVLGYTQAWFQAELTLPEPLLREWLRRRGRGPGGACSRPCGAAQRSCAGSGPLPRAGTQLPVDCVLFVAGGGVWCFCCGAATHAARSVGACNRGPPSSASASTSGLSHPVLPR